MEESSKSIKKNTKEDTPGPGSYEVNLKPSSAKIRIIGKSEEKVKNLVPGPGTYDPIPKPSPSITFKYSIIGKPKEKNVKQELGPGSYDLDSLRSSKSGISFGLDKRKSLPLGNTQFVPGPGAYECYNTPVKEHKAPKYTYERMLKLGSEQSVRLRIPQQLLQVLVLMTQNQLLVMKE